MKEKKLTKINIANGCVVRLDTSKFSRKVKSLDNGKSIVIDDKTLLVLINNLDNEVAVFSVNGVYFKDYINDYVCYAEDNLNAANVNPELKIVKSEFCTITDEFSTVKDKIVDLEEKIKKENSFNNKCRKKYNWNHPRRYRRRYM